ncbi:MAG: AraC family transcriptional regulator [Lachnospiraceae bacterium]|nr:AraC family transcriptional regulator [Lachnospiraceae bacterium]
MIETLNGYHEIVNFKDRPLYRLYHNTESEDYPRHWHSNPEIIMPVKNGYTVEIGDKLYELKENDIIFISSAAIHHLMAPPSGERLIFQPDFSLLAFLPELSSALTIMSPAIIISREKDSELAPRLNHLMLEIEKEYFGKAPLSGANIYSMLIEMFVNVGRKYGNTASSFDVSHDKQIEYTEKFLSICDYINLHFAEDLNLDDISSMCGFSKFHFTRLFKQFTGKTFYYYVNTKRIENAGKLLVNPRASITEVAINSGYSSLPAFVRMFKQIKGVTPSEFRKMHVGCTIKEVKNEKKDNIYFRQIH